MKILLKLYIIIYILDSVYTSKDRAIIMIDNEINSILNIRNNISEKINVIKYNILNLTETLNCYNKKDDILYIIHKLYKLYDDCYFF